MVASPSASPIPAGAGDPEPDRRFSPVPAVTISRTHGTATAKRFGEMIDLCSALRLRSPFRIEIDFCHTFDLATDNRCIDLDRRELYYVAPEQLDSIPGGPPPRYPIRVGTYIIKTETVNSDGGHRVLHLLASH